jgi:hypothetical protein
MQASMFCNHNTHNYLVNTNMHNEAFYHEPADPTEEIIEGHRTVLTILHREAKEIVWYDDISDITDEDNFQYFDDDNSISDESSTSSSSVSTWDEIERLQCLVPVFGNTRRTSATTEGSLPLYFHREMALPSVESYQVIEIKNKDQFNSEITHRSHKRFSHPEFNITLPSETLQESQNDRQLEYEPTAMISSSVNIEKEKSGNPSGSALKSTKNISSSNSTVHQSLNEENQNNQPTCGTSRAISRYSFRSLMNWRSTGGLSTQHDSVTSKYMSYESSQEDLTSMRTKLVSCKPRPRSLRTIIKFNHSNRLKFMRQIMPEAVAIKVPEIV